MGFLGNRILVYWQHQSIAIDFNMALTTLNFFLGLSSFFAVWLNLLCCY